MSDSKRNEGQLVCDVLGLESLVDEITYKLASTAVDEPTATAILGPFYRHEAPKYPMGTCIVSKEINEQGDRTWMHGTITDFRTGKPIEGVVMDVWHTAPNGLYEQQDPDQPEMNLRGRFTTGKDGKYDFYCLRPVPYPIPYDGPAGKILQALDRHPMRPAHIHFLVRQTFLVRATYQCEVLMFRSLQHLATNLLSHRSLTVKASTLKTTPSSRSKTLYLSTLSLSRAIRKPTLNSRMISKWRALRMRRNMVLQAQQKKVPRKYLLTHINNPQTYVSDNLMCCLWTSMLWFRYHNVAVRCTVL
jgi:protocatechuate 3,4-dioxygenase beta subunit